MQISRNKEDKDGKEIDLLIVRNGTIYPIEVKKTASPKKDHVGHFRLLEKLKKPVSSGGVICLAQDVLPLTEKFFSMPVGLL